MGTRVSQDRAPGRVNQAPKHRAFDNSLGLSGHSQPWTQQGTALGGTGPHPPQLPHGFHPLVPCALRPSCVGCFGGQRIWGPHSPGASLRR